MKKLFIVMLFACILLSCEQDYSDVKYQKKEYGSVQIDSTKFHQVLIYDKDDKVFIADKEGVREIMIVDVGETVGLILIIVLVAFVIGIVAGYKD